MTAFNQLKKLSGAIALITVSVSCGDVVRQGSSPVFLVVDQLTASQGGPTSSSEKKNVLQSDVAVNSPAPCSTATPCIYNDSGEVDLRALQKNVSATAPTTNSEVTISRYHVSYRRADGRNTASTCLMASTAPQPARQWAESWFSSLKWFGTWRSWNPH